MKTTDKYIFFWGGIYSQWYKANFIVDGIKYNCAEQFMMAEKARTFNDQDTLNKILSCKNARKQKQFGRMIKNYDNELWNSIRFEIVIKGNYAKFSQNKELKEALLATGNKIVVEASPLDRIWGIGLEENDKRCLDEKCWEGQNLLGKAIMVVRDMLREDNE